MQFLFQLLQGVLAVDQHVIGLHLAQNAAALFPGLDFSVVHAVGHKAAATPRHAADVIARVGIAHISLVAAQPEHTAAGTGHAADVRAVELAVVAGDPGNGDVLNGQGLRRQHRIDVCLVHAVMHHTLIFAHDASQALAAPDVALHGAAVDPSGDLVHAHDAAHLAGTADRSVEADVLQGTGVDTYETSYLGGAARGGHPADELEIFDRGPLLDVPEQAPGGAVLLNGNAVNFMVLAVKNAAEGGDHQVFVAFQINIRL